MLIIVFLDAHERHQLESDGGVQLHDGQRGPQLLHFRHAQARPSPQRAPGSRLRSVCRYRLSDAVGDAVSAQFGYRLLADRPGVCHRYVSRALSARLSPVDDVLSCSYDLTLRIFNHTEGHSREVYHTKRMQRYAGFFFSRFLRGRYSYCACRQHLLGPLQRRCPLRALRQRRYQHPHLEV